MEKRGHGVSVNKNTSEVENYSTQSGSSTLNGHYRVYPVRWAMLVAMIVLNISNGMVCVCMCMSMCACFRLV